MAAPLSAARFVDVGSDRIAYREAGRGDPLLLLHGYPLSGLTFRHVVPTLADGFRCIVPDLLGAGDTQWTDHTDFSFAGQAVMLKRFADELGLTSYRVLAHDTGGTIARQLALIDRDRVTSMMLIGTEIPGHRPPFIPLLQKVSDPRVTGPFKLAMRSKRFLASKAAFGGCFYDSTLIHGEFYATHITPVLADDHRIQGLLHYLRGIDFRLLDTFAVRHREITAPVLLVWGEQDTVFPVAAARPMVGQLGDGRGLVTVPRTRLFVQEERPDEVARIAREFFTAGDRTPIAGR